MEDTDRAEQREQAERRLEIFEAVSLAASRRADVFEAVGQAADLQQAESALGQLLDVGELPAKAILDMQVRQFAESERDRLASMCEHERMHLENLK